jgi:hypothetical protein
MGQQQLLLVLLGVIIVGAAIIIGISMFGDNAVSENRDAMSNDLIALGGRAQTYYRRPRVYGGGNNSFMGLTIGTLTSKASNANGTYSVTSVGANEVMLDAVGVEFGSDGNRLSVTMRVLPDSTILVANN